MVRQIMVQIIREAGPKYVNLHMLEVHSGVEHIFWDMTFEIILVKMATKGRNDKMNES